MNWLLIIITLTTSASQHPIFIDPPTIQTIRVNTEAACVTAGEFLKTIPEQFPYVYVEENIAKEAPLEGRIAYHCVFDGIETAEDPLPLN